MMDAQTLAQMNGEYVMPPDAGPEQRLERHQRFLARVLEMNEAAVRQPHEKRAADDSPR